MIIKVIYVDKLLHKGYPSLPKYAVNILYEKFIENKPSTNIIKIATIFHINILNILKNCPNFSGEWECDKCKTD